jgi:hypothetical protein
MFAIAWRAWVSNFLSGSGTLSVLIGSWPEI